MWKAPRLLHGGDYNPDQWLDRPDILKEDLRMMRLAGVNCVSVGIFSWTALEPEDGVYNFGWLRGVIDSLHENRISVVLATPSGARPAWLAQKYPEVLRVAPDMTRNMMGGRHNHCYTSPVYRKKVHDINVRLAQEFGNHPAVILWHISNEYCGECYCELCQEEFRNWLKRRYGTLDALNAAWWTSFWSKTYTDWSQIEPPVNKGEMCIHALMIDWKRFVTERTVDFCAAEKAAVREGGSELPVTANLMATYYELDYFKFRDVLDVVSWDSYPRWHNNTMSDFEVAARAAFAHDLMRGIKKEPFIMLESTPSNVNWQPISKQKRPGLHMLSSLQAVMHGSDSVMYFQWRKGRGGAEKFHGAVVSHDGRDDTRVFRDVAAVGERLKNLDFLTSKPIPAEVAVVFDYENRWALNAASGIRNAGVGYEETVIAYHQAFWREGISTDIIDMDSSIDGYKLVVAPMLYMLRGGFAERLREFVRTGGTLMASCLCGMVDETDLTYLGGTPAEGLSEVFGLEQDEFIQLYDSERNSLTWNGRPYALRGICETLLLRGAETLSVYGQDFFADTPVLCKNKFGEGTAYYLASGAEQSFYDDFTRWIAGDMELDHAFAGTLPKNVAASSRGAGTERVTALQNYSADDVSVKLAYPVRCVETGTVFAKTLPLTAYEIRFVKPEK